MKSHGSAEALARELIDSLSLDATSCLRLTRLIPQDRSLRGSQTQDGNSFKISFGFYVRAGEALPFNNCNLMPLTCRYLTSLIRFVDPTFEFGALQLLQNVKTGFHLDKGNARGSRNLIVPLTHFLDGQVWTRDDAGSSVLEHQGSSLRGTLCDVASGPVKIDPSVHHAVLPWSGDRCVMVAYMPSFAERLSSSDLSRLSELGFVFRNVNAGRSVVLRDLRPAPCTLPVQVSATKQPPLVLELCAGAAILSAVSESLGFQAMAIDHSEMRSPGKRVMRLDLADPQTTEYLLELIASERHRIALIFLSLPSGTASVSRGRHIEKWARQGFQLPRALRSSEAPDMLPGLPLHDRRRVEEANQLYFETARLVRQACSLNLLVALENPDSSLYWQTSFFQSILTEVQGFDTRFHLCCHGGERPRLLRLWASQDVFSSLEARCDNSHPHKPWKPRLVNRRIRFATADESVYPRLLCQRLVSALATQVDLPLHLSGACCCHSIEH